MAGKHQRLNETLSRGNNKNRLKNSNLESFTCIWLDQNIHTTTDNIAALTNLRQSINYLQTFHNIDECEQYIQQTTQEKIILIVSGGCVREIIPRIHNLPQFRAFYVFCQDQKRNEQWAKQYTKVSGVFIDSKTLLEKLNSDQKYRCKSEDGVSISVINYGSQSLEVRNAMFMWFQLFIEVLLRMHHKSNDRKEIIDICKYQFIGNVKELKIIDEFERDYKPEKAIWWYTRESCFYRMMNKALRRQDFELLFALRFFITDIAKELKTKHETYIRRAVNRNPMRVYRSQMIANDELELMKNSIDQYLSMNSFLSTSRVRDMALKFTKSIPSDEFQRILFEIEIDPRANTTSFASITDKSYFKEEDEVLIMLGALFKIKQVVEEKDEGLWVAQLTLASEDDFQLKDTFSYMKSTIGDDTDLDSLGKILIEMGQYEQAQNVYKLMLNETQLASSAAHLGLGKVSALSKNANEGLEHLNAALRTRETILGQEDANVGECHTWIGMLNWYVLHHYEEALSNLGKAVRIQEAKLAPDSLALAMTYINIADTHNSLGQYDISLNYHMKALEIRKKALPKNHPLIAEAYNNLGSLYESKGSYVEALNYLEKSMEMKRKIFPPTHDEFIVTEKNIRKLKQKMQKNSKQSNVLVPNYSPT